MALAAAAAAVARPLTRQSRRDPVAHAELERAVAAIDRELAANLELTTMFDQTRQPALLENGQFALHGAALARQAPQVHIAANDLYSRIDSAEAAMERRGPANSIKEEDRLIVEAWEGDARVLQRTLRESLTLQLPTPWQRIVARLRERLPVSK